jgi:hypothetical protein
VRGSSRNCWLHWAVSKETYSFSSLASAWRSSNLSATPSSSALRRASATVAPSISSPTALNLGWVARTLRSALAAPQPIFRCRAPPSQMLCSSGIVLATAEPQKARVVVDDGRIPVPTAISSTSYEERAV